MAAREIFPSLGLVGGLLERANQMGFGFLEPREIRQGHAEEHPAFYRIGLELPSLLQQLRRFFQMPAALERHRPRKKPSIKIARALRAHPFINPLGLVVLKPPVKRQSLLE